MRRWKLDAIPPLPASMLLCMGFVIPKAISGLGGFLQLHLLGDSAAEVEKGTNFMKFEKQYQERIKTGDE